MKARGWDRELWQEQLAALDEVSPSQLRQNYTEVKDCDVLRSSFFESHTFSLHSNKPGFLRVEDRKVQYAYNSHLTGLEKQIYWAILMNNAVDL